MSRLPSPLGCEQIQHVFEREFGHSHGILLLGGADEPLYVPGQGEQPHRLYFRGDYAASALHEIAHWCLASDAQLALKDWGLWYVPDGRTVLQQQRFQQVEARVQSVEWMLSVAAGTPFRESSDNLNGDATDDGEFKNTIHRHVLHFCETGLPERAKRMFDALLRYRNVSLEVGAALFDRAALDRLQGACAA